VAGLVPHRCGCSLNSIGRDVNLHGQLRVLICPVIPVRDHGEITRLISFRAPLNDLEGGVVSAQELIDPVPGTRGKSLIARELINKSLARVPPVLGDSQLSRAYEVREREISTRDYMVSDFCW